MKHISLEEWDNKYAPHLKDIELSAGWIEYYARKIKEKATSLQEMPGWQTNAEDALKSATDRMSEMTEILSHTLRDLSLRKGTIK